MTQAQNALTNGQECLRVYASNSLRVLAGKLADLIGQAPLPPLEPEVILVQNPVMGRWLHLTLAEINQGCANLCISMPNAYMHELFSRVVPHAGNEEQSPFSPWAMTWRIMDALDRFLDSPPFTEIQRYLQDDPDGRKRFGLSSRVAGVFDRYLLFRPGMVLNWDQGKGEHWQALLWREISRDFPRQHRPALQQDFFRALDTSSPAPESLPKRISLFGVWGMPPYHLSIFSGLSRVLPVNLFHVSPCRQYWADALSNRQITRITSQSPFTPHEELHLEKGNALLATLGGVGRDFLSLLIDRDCHPEEIYAEPFGVELLGMIQGEILDLTGAESPEKRQAPKGDRSLSIHNCHSPMREMEVLYDHVLRFLEENPGLEPRDILVMAPDMDLYAPYVEAVFSSPGSDGTRIPYSIAHKEIRTISPGINAFLEIMELCQGRFEAVSVLDAAGLPPVAEKFGFFETDQDTLAQWVSQTRIRWGANADSRQALGLPGMGENTWESGLDRLLLGYAMSGSQEDFFQGISPFDDLAMEDAPLLGRFTGFVASLVSLSEKMTHPHTIVEWVNILEGMVFDFLGPETDDIHLLQIALSKLSAAETEHGFFQPVSISVVKAGLINLLGKSMPSAGIMRRGINFCSISQGAGIPSPLICLVGMDDGAFPRQEVALGFDYMARSPKLGDRSPRGDDRFAFLQAILNAEKTLHISYVGQGIQDNAPLCPSPLVSELIDYVEAGFDLSQASPLITIHKLQAFDPAYFSGQTPGLFSYSRQLCQAAIMLQKSRKSPRVFFQQSIAMPQDAERSVDLETLCSFFRLPARFFLRERIGLVLDELSGVVESAEPFNLGGLERHRMAGLMVEKTAQGHHPMDLFPMAKAQGELPHGNVGTWAFNQLAEQMASFAKNTASRLASATRRIDAEVELEGYRVRGRLDPVGPQGLFLYRTATVKAYDRLNAWIRHLLLCLAKPESGLETFYAGIDKTVRFDGLPEDEALRHLAELLSIFSQGLEKPVPFFPETSFAFAKALATSRDHAKALGAARGKWEPGFYNNGESLNAYSALCFEGQNPLSRDFQAIATRVFGPVLEYQQEGGW
ncbi:MAG: exodeoxyribonuclease V subunit gamma [Desulfatibacillum sp.]|nr:exodeoxyribonuclease V subunit gamma [Desulfatibacillum sp.]